MASAEIIEEISQFYDIKQIVSCGQTIYYITHCNIDICIGIKSASYDYYDSCFNENIESLRKNIDRIILLINKLDEMFKFIYTRDINSIMLDNIIVGNVEIRFQLISYVYVSDTTNCKNYDNVCDVIEYLKESCPECIKLSDIKIALKN